MSAQTKFSPKALQMFWTLLETQTGADELDDVLEKGGFSAQDIRSRLAAAKGDAVAAGTIYREVQSALRTYYGRGARGLLVRIGQTMWRQLTENADLSLKLKLNALRVLPLEMRVKRILELAGGWMSDDAAAISAHTLDRDFMFVAHACPLAEDEKASQPICFVMLGFLDEAAHWASGEAYLVEEIACMAAGDAACEFKLTSGD